MKVISIVLWYHKGYTVHHVTVVKGKLSLFSLCQAEWQGALKLVNSPERLGWMVAFSKSHNLLTVHLLKLTADSCLDRQVGKRCLLVTSGQPLLKILLYCIWNFNSKEKLTNNPSEIPLTPTFQTQALQGIQADYHNYSSMKLISTDCSVVQQQ